jgi:hypothetical protein
MGSLVLGDKAGGDEGRPKRARCRVQAKASERSIGQTSRLGQIVQKLNNTLALSHGDINYFWRHVATPGVASPEALPELAIARSLIPT